MTGEQSLALRGGIGIVLASATAIAWRLAPRLQVTSQTFSRIFLAAFAASRLGLFALAYLVLHLAPRGDISLYMEEATPALAGKLVYRDFITPHAPLDPYLLSSMLRLHNSPLTIMFFGIVFDILAMYFWMKALPYFLSSLTLRRAALLVLFNPTSLLTEAIDGQMNSFIALSLAVAVYLTVRHKDFLAGATVAVPSAVIKFLALIYAPGFLFAVFGNRRKVIATLGFVGVLLAVYVPFGLAGADLRTPIHAEGNHKTSSNLIYLVEFVSGHDLGLRLPDVLLGLSWLTVVALTFLAMRSPAAAGSLPQHRRRTFLILTVSLIAELLCVQLFSKNTWDRYLVMAMFPLCVVAAEFTLAEFIPYAVWLAALVYEPSYWATILRLPVSGQAHADLLAHNHHTVVFAAIELVVVTGNLLFFCACIRSLIRLRNPDWQSANAELPDDPALTLA